MNLTECIQTDAEQSTQPVLSPLRQRRWPRHPARDVQRGLGEQLKKYRLRRHWTQSDLRDALKLQGFKFTLPTISRVEKGFSVSLANIRSLRAFLRGQKRKG